jgi:opacity protein-like surface antigen
LTAECDDSLFGDYHAMSSLGATSARGRVGVGLTNGDGSIREEAKKELKKRSNGVKGGGRWQDWGLDWTLGAGLVLGGEASGKLRLVDEV